MYVCIYKYAIIKPLSEIIDFTLLVTTSSLPTDSFKFMHHSILVLGRTGKYRTLNLPNLQKPNLQFAPENRTSDLEPIEPQTLLNK